MTSKKFVMLEDDLLASDAWAFLKPAAKVLFIELKRQFTGSNNGKIFISHRDAALKLGMHRNSIGGLFKQLEDVALIERTANAKIGPAGIGAATLWKIAGLPMPVVREPKEKKKFDKKNPPKFRPWGVDDNDETVLDDEVKF
jgi:hypothetical protein